MFQIDDLLDIRWGDPADLPILKNRLGLGKCRGDAFQDRLVIDQRFHIRSGEIQISGHTF
ncbi:MAG: hypothetical protein LKE28_02635 [Sphaerochaeta sp.]|jgi:hypothetical protein|nr:hypothetical protein [Sphaerochaeta sp.]